jgi:hypothetical protein
MPLSQDDFWGRAEAVLAVGSVVAGATALQARVESLLGCDDWREWSGTRLYDYLLATEMPASRLEPFGSVGDDASRVTWLNSLLDDLERPWDTLHESGTHYWGGVRFGWVVVPDGWVLRDGTWELPDVDVSAHQEEEAREGRDPHGVGRPVPQPTGSQDPESDDDDELLTHSAFGAGSRIAVEKEKEKEKDRKTKEVARVTVDPDGYVLIDGANVMVNGCWMYETQDGSLHAMAGDGSVYDVMKGSAPVTSKAGLTFEHGHAKIGGDALSLDDQWEFAWGVVIADTEKYEQAAFISFRDTLTDLDITGNHPGQVYATVGDVNGYPLHISINASNMREELRKHIARGKTPAGGFLVGANFHVTVEVNGRSSSDNPHVWANSGGGWTGPTTWLGGATAQGAIKKGRDWLSTHR